MSSACGYNDTMTTKRPLWDPYAAIAELYDQEHASFTDDVEMFVNFAQVVGDPILEVGCGSGRILLPIAEAGYHITGLDSSPVMLERLQQQSQEMDVTGFVTTYEGDMQKADEAPGGPFGLVIVSLNSIMHLPTATAQRALLTSAKRALDPKGQLIIDTMNPSAGTIQSLISGPTLEASWTTPDGTEVDKFSARSIDDDPQVMDTRIWYDLTQTDGTMQRIRTRFPLRFVTASELALMLELEGFVDCMFYGSYDLDPYSAESERLIVTAEMTHTEVRS